MDAGDVILLGQRRYRRLVLDGTQQGVVVPDGHHDVGQAGGDDGGQQAVGAIRRSQAVGFVQLRQLRLRQFPYPVGRRHIHPHRIAPNADGQIRGLGVGGDIAVTDAPQRPQQREGGDGGVAAEFHLSRRCEVAQDHAAIRASGDESGLGVLELGGDLLHLRVGQRAVRQHHAGLIAAEQAGRKSVHDIGFHKKYPHRFFNQDNYKLSCHS